MASSRRRRRSRRNVGSKDLVDQLFFVGERRWRGTGSSPALPALLELWFSLSFFGFCDASGEGQAVLPQRLPCQIRVII